MPPPSLPDLEPATARPQPEARQPVEPMKPATPSGRGATSLATGQAGGAGQPGRRRKPRRAKVPADDLVAQADRYIAAIDEAVASEDAYKDAKEEIARNANTLMVIARRWACTTTTTSTGGQARPLAAAQDVAGCQGLWRGQEGGRATEGRRGADASRTAIEVADQSLA